jgi:hypothetical protein
VARERGYLDARSKTSQQAAKAYGLWCWRLKIPLVWFERESRWSKYGRVHLDLYTSARVLTEAGEAALRQLGEGRIEAEVTRHDGCWRRVPRERLAELARAVLRAAIQPAHHQPNPGRAETAAPRLAGKLIPFDRRRAIPA